MSDTKKLYYSQHAQDFWLDNEDIPKTNKGFFFDAGAYHMANGYMSNTLFFEKLYGWRGILVEPNDKISEHVLKRKSKVVNVAISNENKKIHFHKGPMGCQSFIDNKSPKIECKTITTILQENNAPKTIDLLSLDIEGHEYEALQGVDFDTYKFNYAIIESTKNKEDIIDLMKRNGYIFIEKFRFDLFFSRLPYKNKPSKIEGDWNAAAKVGHPIKTQSYTK